MIVHSLLSSKIDLAIITVFQFTRKEVKVEMLQIRFTTSYVKLSLVRR